MADVAKSFSMIRTEGLYISRILDLWLHCVYYKVHWMTGWRSEKGENVHHGVTWQVAGP